MKLPFLLFFERQKWDWKEEKEVAVYHKCVGSHTKNYEKACMRCQHIAFKRQRKFFTASFLTKKTLLKKNEISFGCTYEVDFSQIN